LGLLLYEKASSKNVGEIDTWASPAGICCHPVEKINSSCISR